MNDETILVITNETVIYWDDERNEIVVLIGNDEKRLRASNERNEDDYVLLVGETMCAIVGAYIVQFEIDDATQLIERFTKTVRRGVVWKDERF